MFSNVFFVCLVFFLKLLHPDAEQRGGRMCDNAVEGAGAFPGPPVPEGPPEGPHEKADCDGPPRGAETPQTQETQVCHHLTQL